MDGFLYLSTTATWTRSALTQSHENLIPRAIELNFESPVTVVKVTHATVVNHNICFVFSKVALASPLLHLPFRR